ncbi:CaiB/BaiF CoA-transferase family protein [Diaminobutyricimonas sp. LJ205]|uniref:CaiB/BaiF CoA transferase family protein n=1 Tax=Diaminobutyricimonas sp. LJ205 TaxID=2683590 RepID=UPI0012F508A5|nr:CaiB/BaiF CoA-transferase family protein [Diaminobutyricimonas sp. LJ205]
MIKRALDGIRVISLAEQYPGPLATFLLAELGAEVIQVERPGQGDPQRDLNPELHRAAALNKKSVALDLKTVSGKEAALALVRSADVLVEGFRPGVMSRLGLAYDDLRSLNPRLVYCSMSGFGQSGPNQALTGHNINYEAVVGALDPFTYPDGPLYNEAALPFGDIMAGMTAALAVVAAVHEASKSGVGTFLDIAIADALLLALAPPLTRALAGAETWTRREAAWGVFECKAGYLTLGIAFEDLFWRELCAELGLERFTDLDHDARVDRRDELRPLIASALSAETDEEWMRRLAPRGVPCSQARRLEDVATAPDVVARNMFVTAVDAQGRTHFAVRSPLTRGFHGQLEYRVPALGEHTEEILSELGVKSQGG